MVSLLVPTLTQTRERRITGEAGSIWALGLPFWVPTLFILRTADQERPTGRHKRGGTKLRDLRPRGTEGRCPGQSLVKTQRWVAALVRVGMPLHRRRAAAVGFASECMAWAGLGSGGL